MCATDEIYWYFSHFYKDNFGNAAKKKEHSSFDLNIIKLIWLVKEFQSLIKHHRVQVKSGLAMYINQLILPQLTDSLISLASSNDSRSPLIQEMVEVMRNTQWSDEINGGEASTWLNRQWLKFQYMSLNADSRRFELSSLMSQFLLIAPFLDDFDNRINELGSLKELYYFQNALLEHLSVVLESESQLLKFAECLGYVGVDFHAYYNNFFPSIAPWVSSQSICFTTEIYSVIGHCCACLMHEVAMNTISIQCQTVSSQIVKVLKRTDKPAKVNKSKAFVTVVQRPGSESEFNGPDAELMKMKVQLRWLIIGINHRKKANLGQVDFQPFEFFLDSICAKFKIFLNEDVVLINSTSPSKPQSIKDKDQVFDDIISFEIKRPSVFGMQVKGYFAAISYIDRITGMNCTSVLQEVLVEQTSLEQARRIAETLPDKLVFSIKNKVKGAYKPPAMLPYLIVYVKWYTEFLITKAFTGTSIFSQSRMAFCNLEANWLTSEHYTDKIELIALCEMIGLSGFQFFDEKLTRLITIYAASLDEIMILPQTQEILLNVKKGKIDSSTIGKFLRKLIQITYYFRITISSQEY